MSNCIRLVVSIVGGTERVTDNQNVFENSVYGALKPKENVD